LFHSFLLLIANRQVTRFTLQKYFGAK